MGSKRPGGTPEEELEAWAMRMFDDVEDFWEAETEEQWRAFVEGKIMAAEHAPVTWHGLQACLDAAERVRQDIFEQIPAIKTELGMESAFTTDLSRFIGYRDTTGEFQRKGTFVSRAQIAARLQDYREQHTGAGGVWGW